MKKSNIKSIMHWSIMGLIFGAPIVATLGSLIPKNYEGATNELKFVQAKSIKPGNIYKLSFSDNWVANADYTCSFYIDEVFDYGFNADVSGNPNPRPYIYLSNYRGFYLPNGSVSNVDGFIIFRLKYNTYDTHVEHWLPYFEEQVSSIDYDLGYRTYNAMLDFKNLSINNWYNTMLNLTVGQPTGYDVISVLKMYPLYAIWVVVLDLMYDCMCFIPTMCHHWLHKIEGEDE